MQVAMMQTQCLSRVPTVATHVCRCSGLRPNRTATLSSVHQISGHSAALPAVRGAGCLSHRQLFATRAESGNGASASTSGLPIDLKGIHPVMRSHEAEDCKLQSKINTQIVFVGKKAFIAGVADDQACQISNNRLTEPVSRRLTP